MDAVHAHTELESDAETPEPFDSDPSSLEVVRYAREFSGPLPPGEMLRDYESIVPGSARQLIDSHLYKERVAADALKKVTAAEAFAVVVSSAGVQVLTVGGVAATVLLLINGFEITALATLIPAAGVAIAQVASAFRKGKAG